MKLPLIPLVLLAALISTGSSGCATFSNGNKQTIVVRSTPSGALAKINGTVVGKTPFKVKLARDGVFKIDLEKNGFEPASAVLLPSATNYNRRYLRWGVDYDLGCTTDLVPGALSLELSPALGEATQADRFAEMSALIVRADALLASGELTKADHKYLVGKIVEAFQRP